MPETKEGEWKRKISSWLSNPYNAGLVLIVIAAFLVRLFFFIQTNGQTLWWDEAEYMSAASKWAFGNSYELNPQRPPLFQALSALIFILGLGENFIRMALVVLPSVALVVSMYYLGKEMFNEKIATLTAIFAAVSWTFLFWSARVQPDFLSMTFQVLAIMFMWKYWKKEEVSRYAVYAGVFAAVGFYFKVSALLVPMSFMIFILVKDRLKGFKMKGHYYFAAAFIATLIPYMIWAYVTFGTPFAFTANYSAAFTEAVPRPFAWYNLSFLYILTEGVLFLLFAIGALVSLKWLLYIDVLAKDREKCFDPNLFAIVSMIVVAAFYIFYIRGTEDRWVFLWVPFMFMFASQTIAYIISTSKKVSPYIGKGIAVALIILVCYAQITHASELIDQKKSSYEHVKQAGLWVKENFPKDTKLLSISYTQSTYYSGVNVSTYSNFQNATLFSDYVARTRPDLLQVSAFEQHPQWIQEWINANQDKIIPVQAYFADTARTQPTLIIYRIDAEKFVIQ